MKRGLLLLLEFGKSTSAGRDTGGRTGFMNIYFMLKTRSAAGRQEDYAGTNRDACLLWSDGIKHGENCVGNSAFSSFINRLYGIFLSAQKTLQARNSLNPTW